MTWLEQERAAEAYRAGWARERRKLVRTAISYAVLGVLVAGVVVTVIVRCIP